MAEYPKLADFRVVAHVRADAVAVTGNTLSITAFTLAETANAGAELQENKDRLLCNLSNYVNFACYGEE